MLARQVRPPTSTLAPPPQPDGGPAPPLPPAAVWATLPPPLRQAVRQAALRVAREVADAARR